MNARSWVGPALLGLLVLWPAVAAARGPDVEVWTSKGDDAVYQPGDAIEVRARASQDAYLLVYEIDSEGYVRMLYPLRGSTGFVQAGTTHSVPPEQSNLELVVEQGAVGQCYIVAIAGREQFRELPWYLRPYDVQAEQVGYVGMRDDEDGITSEGRIVGDPFVAMERIRRRVVADAENAEAFGTAYTSYYVHEQVKYPRYLCYDCHRPGRWAWWDGFDPYYTHCSVFDFRVNWGWGWGPSYWFGTVPYYCYVVRHTCPPYYQPYIGTNIWFSSWNGWGHWSRLWGDHLVRFKSDPPAGYTPPSRYRDGSGRAGNPRPPGFLSADYRNGQSRQPRMVTGRNFESRRGDATARDNTPRSEGSVRGRTDGGGVSYRPRADRTPGRQQGDSYEASGGTRGGGMRERSARPAPGEARTPGDETPAPRVIRPRDTAPPEHKPREESSRSGDRRAQPTPAQQPPDTRGGEARPAPSGPPPGGYGVGRGGGARPKG